MLEFISSWRWSRYCKCSLWIFIESRLWG